MSSRSKLHSELHYSLGNAGSFSDSPESLTPTTPPPPPLPPRLIDSPQPPPLPMRNYFGAGDEQRVPSPPPPLPERRYLDDSDDMGLAWVSDPVTQKQTKSLKTPQYSEVDPRLKNRSLEDSFPPPPLPERTSLSEQLVSPGSSLNFTNGSERRHETKGEEALLGRYVVTDKGNRHLLLYDEDMAYAETVIEPQSHISTRSLPPEPSNSHTLQNLRMGMGMHLGDTPSEPQYDVARPPDLPPPSPIYDEAVVPNTLRGMIRVPLNDLDDKDVRYTVHGPGDSISNQRSAQQVEAYEVVPLHRSVTGNSHGSAQLEGRGPLSPPNEPAPPVPLGRSHSKDDTFVNGSSESKEYDTLHHNQALKSLNVTLPRKPTSNATYSQLMLSEAELLQRASATSPLTSPVRGAQDAQPSPAVTRPQKRHEYDVCNLNASGSGHSLDSTPSLVWDNSDLLPTSSTPPLPPPPHPTSPSKPILSHRPIEEESKIPSFSLTEQDHDRREKRLGKHHYHDLDIREWPAMPDDVSPSHNQASQIRAVVRDSWNLANQKPDSLPKGWVREVNEQGQVFYWHIPTGRIQYTRPVNTDASPQRTKTNSSSPPPLSTEPSPAPLDISKGDIKPKVSTFAATYCGSIDVEESSLVRGKCVKVVYQSIHVLSDPNPTGMKLIAGKNAGDMVYLQIQGMVIHWLDPETSNVIVSQPINRIRVWGIGQENDRDFGYVARNPSTHQHQCHVFRCDIAAKGVARALLDSHKENKTKGGGMTGAEGADRQHKVLSPQTSRDRSISPDPIGESSAGGGAVLVKVPLQADERIRSMSSNSELTGDVSESYKRIEATYCGSVDVVGPHGMSLVNDATTQLSYNTKGWTEVFVDIAASHVKILERKNEQLLKEHRVRFLSFLGIASDDRFCGYITDNGDNMFQFHGFRCEPNSDRLCLSLHSACQSRFQRVLDAHLDVGVDTEASQVASSESSAQPFSFLERLGSKRRSKRKKEEEKSSEQAPQSFKVLFNGCEVALKAEGVDAVKKPVKNLTAASSFTSSHSLVELTISNTGFTITDPQKIIFARKQISVKKITYCCRIKNHFTFIAKEGSKLMCYVFTESEDSIANVVSAVQKLMS